MRRPLSLLIRDINSAVEAQRTKRWLFFGEDTDIQCDRRECGFDRYIPVRWNGRTGGLMVIAWQPSNSPGVNKRGELSGGLGKFLRKIVELGQDHGPLREGGLKGRCRAFYEGFYMTDIWKFKPGRMKPRADSAKRMKDFWHDDRQKIWRGILCKEMLLVKPKLVIAIGARVALLLSSAPTSFEVPRIFWIGHYAQKSNRELEIEAAELVQAAADVRMPPPPKRKR